MHTRMVSLTTPDTVTRTLGEDGEECFVSIALLGTRPSHRRYLAILSTTSEVELWLRSHEDAFVDPEQWRAVVVATRRGRFQTATEYIRADDWNHGLRWGTHA